MQENPEPIETRSVCLDDGLIEIPLYEASEMPEGFCSRYARLAADHIFGRIYPVVSAWRMREHTKVIDLKDAQPGMLVGVYFEASEFNRSDRPYTHMSVYLGRQFGKSCFLEQFEDCIRTSDTIQYDMDGMAVVEVLDGHRS